MVIKVPLQFILDLQNLPADNPQGYVDDLIAKLAEPPPKRAVGRPAKPRHPYFTNTEYEELVPLAAARVQEVYQMDVEPAKNQGSEAAPTILLQGGGKRFIVDFGPEHPFTETGAINIKFPPGVEELS